MIALLLLLLRLLVLPSRPQHQLEAENAALKHQLAVLRREQRGRVQLTGIDRLFFVQLYPMVSLDPEDDEYYPARNAAALAS